MRSLLRKSGFLALLVLLAGFAGALGMLSVVIYQVYWGDYSHLERSTILARINEETTIYTRDGDVMIGSFFDNSHRTYVPIDQIPAHMIRAMVASEDQNFYHHYGIDPMAIGSAFMEGVANGMKFRRGGSTITQQTVKNIMANWENSFRRKFQEAIRSLQLERLYSKNEILEFYLNQFHVTANGNGIGIAAKYYFSKPVQELTLVEAAFIAGSVKAPSKYNPFTKYTKAERQAAWDEANERKNYVLRRMYEQGWISAEELKEAWEQEVPFKRGTFTSREVALVSLIRGQLDRKEILSELHLDSIQDMNQAGMKVYTTLDAGLQKQAQLATQRNLSRLEYTMGGFQVEDPSKFRPLRTLEVEEFQFGKVAAIERGGKDKPPHIELDFGLPVGVIPGESLSRVAKILSIPTYKSEEFHLNEILDTVKVGDVLLAEIKEYDKDSHKAVLELRRYPTINGGLIAVDKGDVRAVVAGFEAKGFNRAMFATRQPGSVFKSVIYFAALQLGWNITDTLENERRGFPFQGHLYFPRPDHPTPYKETSILWSGIKSENLASIYLAAHLTDKMNFGQFKQLMGHMGFLPTQGETVSDFHYRVSKSTGIQLNAAGIKEHLLSSAIMDLKPDLVFSGNAELLDHMRKIWWGHGYLNELSQLHEANSDDVSDDELGNRTQLIMSNYIRFLELSDSMQKDWEQIAGLVQTHGPEGVATHSGAQEVLARFRVMSTNNAMPSLAYSKVTAEELELAAKAHRRTINLPVPPGRPLNGVDVQMIWGSGGFMGEQAGIGADDVLLDGQIPLQYLKRITNSLDMRFEAVMAEVDSYGLYRYFNHHDFRIALGLNYAVNLSKAMGVYNKLEPVLSFPLGTNVVSVAEVAKIYQTFTNGKTYKFFDEGADNQLNFISRIEDRDGNIVYQPERTEHQLVEPCLAHQMGEVLRKVVTHGTGSRARGELQLDLDQPDTGNAGKSSKEPLKIRIPAYGKTGTTNDYTTAYFAGFIPYPTGDYSPLDMSNSMVIASYVGYDFNKMMKRGAYKVTGAYGALPVWSDFGRMMLKELKYVDHIDPLDISLVKNRSWPLAKSNCGTPVPVDLPHGIVMGEGIDSNQEVFDSTNFERDGEVFVNEFANTASVKSLVVVRNQRSRSSASGLELYSLPTPVASKVSDAITDDKDLDNDGGDFSQTRESPLTDTPPSGEASEASEGGEESHDPNSDPQNSLPDGSLQYTKKSLNEGDQLSKPHEGQQKDPTKKYKEEDLW